LTLIVQQLMTFQFTLLINCLPSIRSIAEHLQFSMFYLTNSVS